MRSRFALFALCLSLPVQALAGTVVQPTVDSVEISDNMLFVYGQGFYDFAKAWLGDTELVVDTANSTELVAIVPDTVSAGAYTLTVQPGLCPRGCEFATATFPITYGLAGPMGPAGEKGEPGAAGIPSVKTAFRQHTLGGQQSARFEAPCPAGTQAINGGFVVEFHDTMSDVGTVAEQVVIASTGPSTNGWTTIVRNPSTEPVAGSVWAMCIPR